MSEQEIIKEKPFKNWTLLAQATGYSPKYCKMVVKEERSQISKGGKKIMRKYYELINVINY